MQQLVRSAGAAAANKRRVKLNDRFYAEKKNKSWKAADKLIKRYVLPSWGKLRAADISRGDANKLPLFWKAFDKQRRDPRDGCALEPFQRVSG